MADINKINLYGTVYNIEDAVARASAESAQETAEAAQTTATSAQTTANTAKTTADKTLPTCNSNTTLINGAKKEIPVISYNSSEQQIEITKGV